MNQGFFISRVENETIILTIRKYYKLNTNTCSRMLCHTRKFAYENLNSSWKRRNCTTWVNVKKSPNFLTCCRLIFSTPAQPVWAGNESLKHILSLAQLFKKRLKKSCYHLFNSKTAYMYMTKNHIPVVYITDFL